MKLKVNGVEKTINVESDTPLLWVIRDELGLTGTKFGCGAGLCGACTVHLNGSAIRSCITPVAAVLGENISTIEGLADDNGELHPLQQSWIKHNVPQCGYCQPGQLMSAASLLAQNANPTDDEIEAAMAGNICRCGTYSRIKAAIKDTVATQQASLDYSYPAKV